MQSRESARSRTKRLRLESAALAAGLLLVFWTARGFRMRGSDSPEPRSSLGAPPPPAPALTFPIIKNSVRFAVIGDSGTGGTMQYEMAREMVACHRKFPFDFVLMPGDNIYGRKRPQGFDRKFALPYQPLLDDGVKFYASLGNHDRTNEQYYNLFNMNGRRYYTFRKGNARLFALDSNYMDPQQLEWLEKQLGQASEPSKICFFHHPLYSDGRTHGPDLDLRAQLQPLFERYHVNVVLSGHDHVYERINPQHGVYYFVLGNSGQLRRHNLRSSPEMAAGFDTDRDFMMVEIFEDYLYFETVSRPGQIVDHGTLPRQKSNSRGQRSPVRARIHSAASEENRRQIADAVCGVISDCCA
jgi:Calcineurin-like phosphoesterase